MFRRIDKKEEMKKEDTEARVSGKHPNEEGGEGTGKKEQWSRCYRRFHLVVCRVNTLFHDAPVDPTLDQAGILEAS